MTTTRLDLYRWMILSRRLEEGLCSLNPRWFPVEGEEATVVGTFCDLRGDDAAAPHYRGPFVVYLMRGAELWRLAAQALGKRSGYNKGRSVPFNGPADAGFVPWVAGDLGTTLGIATGAGLAFRQEGSDRVSVCSFGDGTANRGDFHENVNLAAVWGLPVVYVCQNNGWAISRPASSYLRVPVVDRAAGYGIPGASVDGNDVEAVRAVVGEAMSRARRGGGPTLVEAVTSRRKGHWAGDTADYRTRRDELPDPLERMADRLAEDGEATRDALARFDADACTTVSDAVERAKKEPDAGSEELGLDEVCG